MAACIRITVLFLLTQTTLFAQPAKCPKLPESYEWRNPRDYKRDEELVVRTLHWLNNSPLNNEIEIRGKASLYVMEWICGSPRIEIVINSDELPFYIDYPDLLFPYIQGFAECKLSKNGNCTELQAMIDGFSIVAFMIQSDAELRKVKALQPISKAYKKGKMQSYVESLADKKL
jgi:hypothetical protein